VEVEVAASTALLDLLFLASLSEPILKRGAINDILVSYLTPCNFLSIDEVNDILIGYVSLSCCLSDANEVIHQISSPWWSQVQYISALTQF
jgi:hypothetical protein